MLSGFVYIIPQHLSTVLFAVASADPQVIARKLRFTLGISILVGVPAAVVLGLGAHLALSLFGPGYAGIATFTLVTLALGYLPSIPKVHYIAVCRAVGKVNRAAVVLTTFAVIEVGAAALGGLLRGLNGLAVALLIVAVVEGLATTPAVVRAAIARGRHRRAADTADDAGAGRAAGVSDGPTGRRARARSAAGGMEARSLSRDLDEPTDAEARDSGKKAQQEAGLAALLSLATTIGPDRPIPGIPASLPHQTTRR